jgi:hypothetical protein
MAVGSASFCRIGIGIIMESRIRIRNWNADLAPGAKKFIKSKINLIFSLSEWLLYYVDMFNDPDSHGSTYVYLPGSGSGYALR